MRRAGGTRSCDAALVSHQQTWTVSAASSASTIAPLACTDEMPAGANARNASKVSNLGDAWPSGLVIDWRRAYPRADSMILMRRKAVITVPADILDQDRYSDMVAAEIVMLAEAIRRTDADTPVPTCPGWTARMLATHIGMIHRWVRQTVRDSSPGGVARIR
jgi:hypothetical protein